MKPTIALDQSTIRILYLKYKEYFLPTAIMSISFLLLWYVLLPQYTELRQMQQEEKEIIAKNKILSANFLLLNAIDSNTLDSQIQVLGSAFPIEKDYVGILRSISRSARGSGVDLDDFSFLVGELSTESGRLKDQKPFIKITLNLRGGIDSLKEFLSVLSESFPLSEVQTLKAVGSNHEIVISFFYRPLQSTKTNSEAALQPITKEARDLIVTLSSWREKNGIDSDEFFSNISLPSPDASSGSLLRESLILPQSFEATSEASVVQP